MNHWVFLFYKVCSFTQQWYLFATLFPVTNVSAYETWLHAVKVNLKDLSVYAFRKGKLDSGVQWICTNLQRGFSYTLPLCVGVGTWVCMGMCARICMYASNQYIYSCGHGCLCG